MLDPCDSVGAMLGAVGERLSTHARGRDYVKRSDHRTCAVRGRGHRAGPDAARAAIVAEEL